MTLHFFFFSTLFAEMLFPLYFESMPNLSKTLEGLLTPLVIFVNTIVQLNSLNITVSVCYMSGSKVNRKERSRPSLFNLFVLVFHLAKCINFGAFGSVVKSCRGEQLRITLSKMKSCSLKSRERHKIQRNKHFSKAFVLADKYKYIAKVIS